MTFPNKTKLAFNIFLLCFFLFSFIGAYALYKSNEEGRQEYKIKLTMWDSFGGKKNSPMQKAVDKFNETVGKDVGIYIDIVLNMDSNINDNNLVLSALGYPGSEKLPDLFFAYPKTILQMGTNKVADWKTLLQKDELDELVQEFMLEGNIDDQLKILPVAKSTNLLWINKTLFDKFSADTGCTLDDLKTWKGFFKTAETYYQWSGGKSFFKYEDWSHYPFVSLEEHNEHFLRLNSDIPWESKYFQDIMKQMLKSAIQGHAHLIPSYISLDLQKGNIVCGVSSSAAVMYVNSGEKKEKTMEIAVLQLPHFENLKKIWFQRGRGLCIKSGNREKELAAAIFARWFIAEENNLPFTIRSGYVPVKNKSFLNIKTNEGSISYPSKLHEDLYSCIKELISSGFFLSIPNLQNFSSVALAFDVAFRDTASKYRNQFNSTECNLDKLTQEAFRELQIKAESLYFVYIALMEEFEYQL